MIKKKFSYHLLILILPILVSCTITPERDFTNVDLIPVFDVTKKLKVKESNIDVEIEIPTARQNYIWPHSRAGHYFSRGNKVLKNDAKDLIFHKDYGKKVANHVHLDIAPLIANNKVYVVDGKGTITAFKSDVPFSVLWTQKLPNFTHKLYGGGISFYDDTLLVTLGNNSIYALNSETGDIIWHKQVLHLIRAAPSANLNTVVVKSINGISYGFDIENGNLLWSHFASGTETTLLGSSPPVITHDKVLITHDSGEVYVLDLNKGYEIWSDNIVNPSPVYLKFNDLDLTPLILMDSFVVFSNIGQIVAYDSKYLHRKWEKDILITSQPWSAGNYLFAIAEDSYLICLDLRTGELIWSNNIREQLSIGKERNINGPFMANNKLFVYLSSGKLLSLSYIDGSIIDITDILKSVYVAPSLANDKLYICNDEAELAIYE